MNSRRLGGLAGILLLLSGVQPGVAGADSDVVASFDDQRGRLQGLWTGEVDRVTIDLPAKDVADTLKSQLAYILINQDGPAIQPGSRQYERSWIRDGSMTAPVLLRMGRADIVRDFIDWYAHFITPEGKVPPSFRADDPLDAGPGSGIEWDGQGAYVYMIMEYYRFTHDREFLAKHFPKMRRSLEFLVALREQTLAADYWKDEPARERFVGILPKSFSHEGYCPEMHSYWDDFWALRGWRDGKAAAEILGDTNTATWAEQQYWLLRRSVKASIEQTIAFKKITYIPGCAEKGDFDATSTAIAIHPCEEWDWLPQDVLRATFDRYYGDVRERLKPDWRGSFTPYEARNIYAFVALGQKERANFLLEYLMQCRQPPAWNHVAEVVLGDPRIGSYIGDMPHTWAGASLVNSVILMLVRESGDRLVLFDGAPESWVRDGQGIRLENVGTYFGPLNATAKMTGNTLTVRVGGANPPGGFEIRWPVSGAPSRIVVDGRELPGVDSTACTVPAGAREIIAQW